MASSALFRQAGGCPAFHCGCEFNHVRRREAPQQGCRGQDSLGNFESQANHDRERSELHLKGGTQL